MPSKFGIFISYRRKGGYDTAKLLYDRLRMDGYAVSFDIDTLEKGNFDSELEKRVGDCKDFLLVLSPGVFDRFFDADCRPEDDWVRREIVCALRGGKNIVPLMLADFEYPKALPDDVKDIMRKNSIVLSPMHFEAAYGTLKRKFLESKPQWQTRHRKKIAAAVAAALLALALGAALAISEMRSAAEMKDREIQEARQAALRADSIRVAELARITDSIKEAAMAAAAAAASEAAAEPEPQAKAGSEKGAHSKAARTLHWTGSNDAIGQAVFNKLSSAGIKKSKCAGDGIAVSAGKASCKANAVAKVTCSYAPRIAMAACTGKALGSKELPPLKSSPRATEAEAREDIAQQVAKSDFREAIAALKGARER